MKRLPAPPAEPAIAEFHNGVRGQVLVAALAASFAVAFLGRWFKTRTLIPFGVYCLLFGLAMVIYTELRTIADGWPGPAAARPAV
jgi:hypothetical protein